VSWNLLAPIYAPSSKYPWANEDHLSWDYRKSKIISTLQSDAPRPDIVTLQEVQISSWEEDLRDKLELDGVYYSLLQNVTRGHPVANAILVRNGFADCIAVESRSRALLTVLQLRDKAKSKVFLANVHLEAGYKQDDTRFNQIKSLLKRMKNLIDKYGDRSKQYHEHAVVLVGDFNMRPDNPLYHLLRKGVFPKELTDEYDIPGLREIIEKQRLQKRSLPLLPLYDAYCEKIPRDGGVRMTYMGGAVLDYMWITRPFENRNNRNSVDASSPIIVKETWRSHPDASFQQRQPWPNSHHPSDHLPIGAVLTVNHDVNSNVDDTDDPHAP